jgi:hypothetical protein
MKQLLLILVLTLVGCGPRPEKISVIKEVVVIQEAKPEGCEVETSSNHVTKLQVSDIQNLVTDIDLNGRCTVNFDLTVNGQKYHLTETETGWQQIPSLCYYAKERARKNLLLDIGGDFKTEANITCRHRDTING